MKIVSAIDAPKMYKITGLSNQIKARNRVNVSVDGKYAFSLDIVQVGELSIKVGMEVDSMRLEELKLASHFGKLYSRTLEYTLVRPRSEREVRDYLHKKTLDRRTQVKAKSGEYRVKICPGIPKNVAEQVLSRLKERGHIDDKKFAQFWVDNRMLSKGVSQRRLRQELSKKGVALEIINEVLCSSDRSDDQELQKMISKKRTKYTKEKLISYLVRQGFNYNDIKSALQGQL